MNRLEHKKQRPEEKYEWAGSDTTFRAYVQTLEMVTYFRYFGWHLPATDDNWIEFISNIQKARRIWDCLSRIMGRESMDSWKLGRFNLIITQAILLFGVIPGW